MLNRKIEQAPLVFCCRADNDLFRVVTTNRGTQVRCGEALEAVQRAPEGAGVLILADGYPKQRTGVDAAVFDLAARKKLRVYVEYPAWLPGLSLGEPAYLKTGLYGSVLERTVVASDAFGPTLPKRRILMIHDCHYLPVEATDLHLVLARVEGYDTAVYGLPEEVHPILFEHPRGGVLVATTKLSQFVTARYAPTEAWPAVWRMILGWLKPGEKTLPDLKWTPTVRPMYQAKEALPEDAEQQALRRGIEYYDKSRLYIHPSWPKDTGLDPLGADWPVGDGTDGIGECYISKRIFVDGSQAVSRTVRCDCNLEAAMGLAGGAVVLGDKKYAERAKKLADWVFFHPNLGEGGGDDPACPTYGLIPWDMVTVPSVYYGDDNARLVLSAIAAGALLESEHWDEGIVRCILANFRTTGICGFRPRRFNGDELHQTGWQHHFKSTIIDYCPHFEAWLWVTFLWLYGQTGYVPLLERARTGVRMMMAAYPDWRLEANRVEAERCRMLLPLAWLVRVDDTAEHRRWLDTIARYVIDLQDASGAIPQIPGTIVASNEGFGTGECALVHEAGDPATDALYSINFAFVGMYEAAAVTGKAAYARSADRMADFFIRTQTRSEHHPELDGTWYRGFDFRKWDYWASDGDWGWGVWTNEIGWTHSWITTGLALRQMKTCLWDLCHSRRITDIFDTFRKQMLPEVLP